MPDRNVHSVSGVLLRRVFDPDDDQWRRHAACAGMDPAVFFPWQGESVSEARDACASCPVATQCARYAVDNNIFHGIWGGTTERQRRDQRRARRNP